MDDALGQAVRAALARLGGHGAGTPPTIMGAGSDDLERGRRWLAALAPDGLGMPAWPPHAGGRGAGPDEVQAIRAALAEADPPDLYPWSVGLSMVGPVLLEHGTRAQQERWLPRIADGTEVWCQMFSEPDAGSDLASLTCRAERDGEQWRISGQKLWASRAHYSQWGLLLARTDPHAEKHAGITAFVVAMDAPGITVRPVVQMNGDRHFNEVFLDDVAVPDAHRVGAPGTGWAVARTTLAHERAAIGSRGDAGSVEHRLVALAAARGATGDPVVRQRLADRLVAHDVAAWTAQRARARAAAGDAPGPEGSGAKLRHAATMKAIGDLAADVLGMDAVAQDGDDTDEAWRVLFLTGPSFSIRGGTDEIQRNIVAERALGLPR